MSDTNPYASPQASVESRTGGTHVRWGILALLMAFAGLCHFNRTSISVAGTERMMEQYGISETQMGMTITAYLIIYTLCMMPGGWLIDRIGPHKSLLLMGLGTAILVPLTGATGFVPVITSAATMLPALFVIRGVLGLVSTPMHPGAARSVSFWMPPHARGIANGLVTFAAVVGIAMTYYAFGVLMDLVGWPTAFQVTGGITLLLTILWWWYATDRPGQHPDVNAAERRLIEGEKTDHAAAAAAETALPPPTASDFFALLCNRNLILLTLSYALVSYFQYLFFYWLQYYFKNVLELEKDASRLYATIPTLAMAVGMLCGGWLADRAQEYWGGRVGRAIVPVGGILAGAVFLALGIIGGPPQNVVTCFALSMGAVGASESSFWVTGIEIGGRRGGLSGAILNAGGNLGGLLAPVITPLFSHYFGWQAGLFLACGCCAVGGVLWLWISPSAQGNVAD